MKPPYVKITDPDPANFRTCSICGKREDSGFIREKGWCNNCEVDRLSRLPRPTKTTALKTYTMSHRAYRCYICGMPTGVPGEECNACLGEMNPSGRLP